MHTHRCMTPCTHRNTHAVAAMHACTWIQMLAHTCTYNLHAQTRPHTHAHMQDARLHAHAHARVHSHTQSTRTHTHMRATTHRHGWHGHAPRRREQARRRTRKAVTPCSSPQRRRLLLLGTNFCFDVFVIFLDRKDMGLEPNPSLTDGRCDF